MATPTRRIFEIPDALSSLRPASSWSHTGTDYSGITWLDTENPCPTEQEVQAEVGRLQAEYDAEFYKIARVAAYPAIGDQLDALFHAGVFPPEMAAQIQAVKDQFPKPTIS
jgi:hypothetical protein